MPDIDSNIFSHYSPDDVMVVALHPGDPPNLVADFLEQTGIGFPVVQDQGTRSLFNYPQGVGYPYPRDVIIDQNGIVRSIKNSFDVIEAQALIDELLAE